MNLIILFVLAVPFYNADDVSPDALKLTDAQLDPTLKMHFAQKRVAKLERGGEVVEIGKLTRLEKIAVYYAMGSESGAELDLMLADAGAYTPIEVVWTDDVVRVKSGAPRTAIYATRPLSKEALQKKYGIGPFVDSGSSWNDDTLFVVDTALASLTSKELKGIAGLPFHRMPKDPHGKRVRGVAIAMYVPEKSQIELYDHAIEADKRKFYGSVDAPVPLSVATLIHELGHAIARASSRELQQEAQKTKAEYDAINDKLIAEKKTYDVDKATYQKTKDPALGKSLNERAATLKPLIEQLAVKKKAFEAVAAKMVAAERTGSPLEQAFDKRLSFRKAPTVYGRTSIGESYADSFALFKADRAAFERAAPGVPAWFESSEYAAMLAP